jgi:hypothetical protein
MFTLKRVQASEYLTINNLDVTRQNIIMPTSGVPNPRSNPHYKLKYSRPLCRPSSSLSSYHRGKMEISNCRFSHLQNRNILRIPLHTILHQSVSSWLSRVLESLPMSVSGISVLKRGTIPWQNSQIGGLWQWAQY